MHIYYICLSSNNYTPFNLFPKCDFSCMSSGCCIQQQFLMSWCVIHDCISLLKNTSTSGWSMFRRWRLPIQHVCTHQRSSLSEALSQASSSFNVDVQKLLFVLFCAHSSEDWLSRTVQNREKREAGLLPANIKMFTLCLAQGKPLINILIHSSICISIYHEKWQV